MAEDETVKVAVRVRPFNKRERARNATLIVEMKGSTTYLTDPEDKSEDPKKFTFDHSYWSHDGCKEEASGFYGKDTSHPNGKKFADQNQVFDDLGMCVLNNAWGGFNSTLFAYGQTGSGKSWSVVGYGPNPGIVPLFCAKMFSGIDEKKAAGEGIEFEMSFSMLEIYMEEVKDLLASKSKRGGLKVRQHPKKGFYAEGLIVTPVGSYEEIEGKIEEGTKNRTVAATAMNATSSRAHTIVGITFVQKFKNAAGQDTTKSATVNLVDLAGSERAESTGATGDRLKEGASINQSLSSLGNVIAALADQSNGKKTRVPFRDSCLTKLLKNALGGNSKTIMIAAISPADINYDETLSTLRYADRAKQIKCKATVNEDPTEKLIRELQEENDKLKQMLESGGVKLPSGEDDDDDTEGMTEAEKEELRKEMEEDHKAQLDGNAAEMEDMKKDFEQKLKEAREAGGAVADEQRHVNERRKTVVHIWNLNFDPQLSGRIVQFVDDPKELVGNGKVEGTDIILRAPSILDEHAFFTMEGGQVFLEKANAAARLVRNGEALTQKTAINHNDRLVFGTTQVYVFSNPIERDASKEKFPQVTYDMAQEEIAANSGFDMQTENKSRDDMLLQEDMVEMLPAVEEANSISEDLDQKKKFELMLVSPEARGELKGRTQIFVKVIDMETDHEWVWPREKFLNRKFIMQEMFSKYEDGEDWKLPQERDPFAVDPNAEVHIGSVKVWLQSLAYNIELREQLEITDFKGAEVGLLNVDIIPCNKKGKDYSEGDDIWVESPNQLVGKDLHFVAKVNSARGLPNKYTDIYAKYVVYLETDYTCTKVIKDTSNPDWNHNKQFDFQPATDQLVNYLQTGAIMIQVWGKQKPPKNKKNINTKDANNKESLAKGAIHAANTNVKMVDAQKVQFAMGLAVMKKKAERAEAKVAQFRSLVSLAEEHEKWSITTRLLKDLLHAPNQDVAEKCLRLVPKDEGGKGKKGNKKASNGTKHSDNGEKKSSTCLLL